MALLIGNEARQYRETFEDFRSILDYDLEEDELRAVRELLCGMLAQVDSRIVVEMRENSGSFDAKNGVKLVIL